MASTVTESSPHRPKQTFGMVQLMLLTGICAVSFACAFPSSNVPGRPNPDSLFWKVFMAVPEIALGILSFTGSSIVIARWWDSKTAPTEPGRILLLILASLFIFGNLFESIYIVIIKSMGEAAIDSQMIIAGTTYVRLIAPLFLAVVCLWAAKSNRWWWRISFVLLAIAYLASLATVISHYALATQKVATVGSLYLSVSLVIAATRAIAMLSVLVCCIVDAVKRVKRSRLHWYGVICFAICLLMPPVFSLIIYRFLSVQQIFGS